MFQKHYRRVLGSCIIFNTPALFPVCGRNRGFFVCALTLMSDRDPCRRPFVLHSPLLVPPRVRTRVCVSACVQMLWKTVEPLLARFHKDRVVWLKGEGDQGSLSQLGTLLGHGTLASVLDQYPDYHLMAGSVTSPLSSAGAASGSSSTLKSPSFDKLLQQASPLGPSNPGFDPTPDPVIKSLVFADASAASSGAGAGASSPAATAAVPAVTAASAPAAPPASDAAPAPADDAATSSGDVTAVSTQLSDVTLS